MINGNFKNWMAIISTTVLIITCIVGYIYAEATASRERDMTIVISSQIEHKDIRAQINRNQVAQMAMLGDIKTGMVAVQKDIEHIKNGG